MIKLILYLWLLPPNIEDVYAECQKEGVLFPYIVTQQAILETGHFKSYNCRVRNNLFGLTKSNGKYFKFGHWKESIKAYRDYVQYRYKGGNYYKWLNKIGYATAKNYVKTLKRIRLFKK